MHLLITAGPTREFLDEVRYLSNASSGRMGYALAAAGVRRGHRVTLVSGPVELEPPAGVELVRVVTGGEMRDACLRALDGCDGVLGVAAVCDYRPAERTAGKIKRTGQKRSLELVETPDILAELASRKGDRWVVGFAVESANEQAEAVRKLREKNCDAIVLNRPDVIGQAETRIEIFDRAGRAVLERSGPKTEVAEAILAWIESELAGDGSKGRAT